MKIDELLREEDAGWTEIHRLIDPLSPAQAETPGYFPEGWSVKDLLGHLGSWLAEAGIALERIRVGTYRPGELDIDAKNEAFLEALRPLTLRETHAQAEAARAQRYPRMRPGGSRRPDPRTTPAISPGCGSGSRSSDRERSRPGITREP